MRQNLINQLGELSKFCHVLESTVLTKDDICQLIGLGLVDGKTLEVAIFEIAENSTMKFTGSFGRRLGRKSDHVVLDLDTLSPAGMAMVERRIIWCRDSDELLAEFPRSFFLPNVNLIGSLIALPILNLGRVVGCLLIEGEPMEYDFLLAAKLELVCAMLSHKLGAHLASNDQLQASKIVLRNLPLTGRELIVQEMMSQNHSNREIAESIGYSESTVRQDAISLFAKLNVTNRKQAGILFHAN